MGQAPHLVFQGADARILLLGLAALQIAGCRLSCAGLARLFLVAGTEELGAGRAAAERQRKRQQRKPAMRWIIMMRLYV